MPGENKSISNFSFVSIMNSQDSIGNIGLAPNVKELDSQAELFVDKLYHEQAVRS